MMSSAVSPSEYTVILFRFPSQPAQDQLATASVSRHMDTEPVSPAWVYGSTPIPGV